MTDTAALAGFGDKPAIGDNLPPDDADPLLERLKEDHAALIARRAELLAAVERAPEAIDDEEVAGKMADFAAQMTAFVKAARAAHQAEKSPFLQAGRTVDSFLHALVDDVENGKKVIDSRRKAYADRKAAEERRRREAEAAKAREEEERARREAEEAAAALAEEEDLDKAIAAEEAAEAAKREAERAATAAAAKPAELGRTRGEYGGMTTLKQFWNFRDLDRGKIDLEALRQHLAADALEKAVRSWIAANKDALKEGVRLGGVEIFEDTRL